LKTIHTLGYVDRHATDSNYTVSRVGTAHWEHINPRTSLLRYTQRFTISGLLLLIAWNY